MKILVSGYLIRKPVAGLAWHYGQYLVGLKKLGHDVLYVEDSECLSASVKANLRYAKRVFEYLGLPDEWMFFDFCTDAWTGPARRSAWREIDDADMLISISGPLAVTEWFHNVPTRIFVDTDPVFTQAKIMHYPSWSSRCANYTCLASFGRNINRPDCGIPRDGYSWCTTRQPIVLDLWETSQRTRPVLTTIMSWRSYASVSAEGVRLGVKAHTFGPIQSLPMRASAKLEIALDADPEVRAGLAKQGWGIVSARSISGAADVYKAYIQGSLGEFTVAKEAYVKSWSGWFSERSACYLASGRPVITQDTGFSTWLETGSGVLSFHSEDEAVAAIESVVSSYDEHAEAARELSRQFDSTLVLQKLLDDAHSAPSTELAPRSPAALNRDAYNLVVQQIESAVPESAKLVMIGGRQFGLFGYLSKRKVYQFVERDGQYWGNPETSNHAIAELNRLIALGATHLVILKASYWWLEYYSEFWDFVVKHGVIDFRTDEAIIVTLRRVESDID